MKYMKKLIAGILVSILASAGYIAVDRSIEERVSRLEEECSSMQEALSYCQSAHGCHEPTTSHECTTKEYLPDVHPNNPHFDTDV